MGSVALPQLGATGRESLPEGPDAMKRAGSRGAGERGQDGGAMRMQIDGENGTQIAPATGVARPH